MQVRRRKQKTIERRSEVEKTKRGRPFGELQGVCFFSKKRLAAGRQKHHFDGCELFDGIHPDLIKSYLPFFGRGYSGIAYGGDNGMDFEGKPKVYTIEKTKKAYVIKAEVKGERDSYSIILSVYFEGNAYLSVNSNNRSSISYDGSIEAIKKKK